jgi:hypothetical protein
MSTETNNIFDKVLSLNPSEQLVIPFTSLAELRSKKTLLHREKTKYELLMQSTSNFKPIFISQRVKTEQGIFELILTCSAGNSYLENAVVQRGDGSLENAGFTNCVDTSNYAEKQRVRELMEADGCGEDEINATLEAL